MRGISWSWLGIVSLLFRAKESEAFLNFQLFCRLRLKFPPSLSTVTLGTPHQQSGGDLLSPASLKGYGNCTSFSQARRLLRDRLLKEDRNRLFDSVSIPDGASSRTISDGDLAIQTRLVNRKYKITELIELSGDRDADRASLAVICVMIGSTTSAFLANQNLQGPEILRFVVVWAFCFAPLAFVGYGIADVENLQAVLVMIQRNLFPAYRQRMIQHEAGHFLLGHLLGWPIRTYGANAVKNAVEFFPFADTDKGAERARQLGFDARPTSRDSPSSNFEEAKRLADVPYFSKEGQGATLLEKMSVFREEEEEDFEDSLKKPSPNDPSAAWPFRGFSDSELDRLAVISVAGVCAEILAFGNAEGGVADFNQLRQIFKVSADSELTERDCENRIRFALAFALTQLRRHLGALDALAAVMERNGTVEECVVAIESCVFVSGQDGILDDYEVRRRQLFRNIGLVEKLFLGGGRNADTNEDRLIEGRGGGYRKSTFRLSGDDPLYAALAVSFLFLIWASQGGLSLH